MFTAALPIRHNKISMKIRRESRWIKDEARDINNHYYILYSYIPGYKIIYISDGTDGESDACPCLRGRVRGAGARTWKLNHR